ncbi:MAG: hypothetical protein IPP28_00910 [Xanthomonadales bacterium]|nr:hypothetical protein [Xanthomonadales bacterium]
MEIVLIAILVVMCWAVWRASTATDRSRKSYAARHLLGSLPEADRSRRGGSAGSAQAKPENPSWVIPATAMETVDLFEDDRFPLFGTGMQPGRLSEVDHSDPYDFDPSNPMSHVFTDAASETFGSSLHNDDVGHSHYDPFSDS